MRLFFARHGQTEWNLAGRHQGQRDSPLTAAGERQARLLAARLAAEPLDAAYSSDLGRARRTAELILGGRPLPLIADPAWRELSYGAWEGLTGEEIAARYPEAWARRQADRLRVAPPGGETLLALERRVAGALDRLAQRHAGQQVLVVTHGGALWALACRLHGDDLATTPRAGPGNCSLSVLRWTSAGPDIECWNDVAHLGERAG